MDKYTKISKFLSFILRHNPQSIQLKLDTNGWAKIDELIAKSKDVKLTKKLISETVKQDSKQRFIIDENKIRANQGHSIKINLGLEAVVPPKILYHGTATRFLLSIMETGLTKQARQHVHLSTDIQTATTVGKRHGKVIILEIDAKKMHELGYKFYISENAVWLTDNIPIEFLKELD